MMNIRNLKGNSFRFVQLTHKIFRLESTVARLKSKKIDVSVFKSWIMWINSSLRAKPYRFLTFRKRLSFRNLVYFLKYRCCMVVDSSCFEMLGSFLGNERNA